ncbi:hypothetical protein [Chondromyces apiculatus]|uniref:Uncharacterized protein n=1 Tax=Chondromyces apiculatus DSM 436 TaxID=1192034 RepID=A0A017TA23_9BACT|nr:hypothetical protein [Chondromyces apiculatus]EYF06118.1 Hypothetical protein CAP_2308 [Chondromyces apiculatus DSM 436]
MSTPPIPEQKYGGEADLRTPTDADANDTALLPTLTEMVRGVGQSGCGYEAQFESWYRFLVDPEPYTSIMVKDGWATLEGKDDALLGQRADFLRPDSLLAILMLSDENDCSMREGRDNVIIADGGRMPRPRAECAVDPSHPCCKSCLQERGECPVDPTCYPNGDSTKPVLGLEEEEDPANLRCFEQKRRFGVDFLYPVDRYTKALTSRQIQNRKGELVDNPLFSDLGGGDGRVNVRDPSLVFFAGIVGVPWQDIARDPANPGAGVKNSDELSAPVGSFASTWEVILGNPGEHVPPADPFMRESLEPRAGTNPILDVALSAPGATPNAINGTEWTIPKKDDLQFACVFPLTVAKDCSVSGTPGCDCQKSPDIPLCDVDPGSGARTLQTRAKAFPGLRELEVIRSLDTQGIVGSVCPAQLDDPEAADFGYRPTIGAIIERLKVALVGQCLPRSLQPGEGGQVSCLVIEARNSGGACTCDGATGRREVTEDNDAVRAVIAEDALADTAGWDCLCEVVQLAGTELTACQTDLDEPVQDGGNDVNGWCYVDATTAKPVGDPALVQTCPSTERRMIRFVGKADVEAGATQFITCSGEQG